MRRFRIKNGDGFSREQEVNHYSAAFPRHFMWGHGTPNCSRMVAFGKEAAFRRFLLQGDRTMAQDCTFVLKAFDEISRKQFHRRIFLQLRANPSVASSAMTMTKEELDIAMRHYQAVEHAARTSRPPPADPSAWTDTGSAKQVLGLVQRAAGKAFGSKEERIDMGHHAIAMYTLHGRPHRMLTVTPSDSNSVWIAHHSGLLNFTQENPESFKELFDLEAMKKFPSEKAIRSACNKDPVLCAVKFDHMIKEYIIPVVLGWDMEAGRSFPGCGEFNELNGFVASVESQGDKAGTLHAHILIWEKTRDERPDSVRFKTATEEASVWSAWKQVQKKSVDENGKDIVDENGKFKMDLPEPDENWVRPKSEEQFEDEVRNVVDASSSATYPTFELFIDETGEEPVFHCPECLVVACRDEDSFRVGSYSQKEHQHDLKSALGAAGYFFWRF